MLEKKKLFIAFTAGMAFMYILVVIAVFIFQS